MILSAIPVKNLIPLLYTLALNAEKPSLVPQKRSMVYGARRNVMIDISREILHPISSKRNGT
jgi:hypothetical protein